MTTISMNYSYADTYTRNLQSIDVVGIQKYLTTLENARGNGDWLNVDLFPKLLAQGMHAGKLTASDLVEEEGISRSSITKWIQEKAVPQQAIRKVVLQWIENSLNERLHQFYTNPEKIIDKEKVLLSKVKRWSNSRIALHELSIKERDAITNRIKKISCMGRLDKHENDIKLYSAAQILSLDLSEYAPNFTHFLDEAIKGGKKDIIHVSKLPDNEGTSNLLPLAISLRIGHPINFYTHKNTGLVNEKTGGVALSHGQRRKIPKNALKAFTLFASFPRVCRPEWIVNFGVANPKGVESKYVPFLNIYDELSLKARQALLRYKVTFAVPRAYGYDKLKYVSQGSILDVTSDGNIEINVPRSLSQIHMAKCSGLLEALHELESAIETKVQKFIVRPGTFLAVNNYRGLHLRQQREYPDFMTLRTFVLSNLETIKYLTGSEGPVFDARKILDQHIIPE